MKKVLPLVLFVLLAFAGCQRGPATYEFSQNPRQISINAEKFVNQVEKKDWDVAIDEFVHMCKNYVEFANQLTQDEQMKYDNARVKFMHAIDVNGTEEMAKRVKEEYGRMMGN